MLIRGEALQCVFPWECGQTESGTEVSSRVLTSAHDLGSVAFSRAVGALCNWSGECFPESIIEQLAYPFFKWQRDYHFEHSLF